MAVGIIKSFKDAVTGIAHILRSERNARIHVGIAFAVLAVGIMLNLSVIELAATFFSIITIFLAEIANTALEKTLDLIEPHPNDKIRLVKDMAAGAVLIASVGAAVIGIIIFWPYLAEILWRL